MQRSERTFPGAPITLRGTLVVYLGTMATRLGAPVGLILLALLFSGCGEGEGDGSAGDRAGEEPGAAAEPPSPDTTLPGVPGTVPTPTDSFAGELAITFDDLPWVGPLPLARASYSRRAGSSRRSGSTTRLPSASSTVRGPLPAHRRSGSGSMPATASGTIRRTTSTSTAHPPPSGSPPPGAATAISAS